MVIINPVGTAIAPGAPYNQITPFTYRDGLTYLEVLEAIRKYITDVLVPHIDDSFEELEDFVNAAIAANEQWTIEQINTLKAYVDAAVEQIINDSIEVQDPLVAQIFENANSATRIVTDQLYDKVIEDPDDPGFFISV